MAINTNVFRGSDATLTLAPIAAGQSGTLPDEVSAGSALIDSFALGAVGRASGVEVYVQTSLKAYHEIGRRHAAQLRPGLIDVSGRIGRAHINGALLRLLMGSSALVERGPDPAPQPTFNLQVILKDPANPNTSSTLTVYGVKFENWSYALPEDDFVMESVTFQGLFISVEDKQAAT